MVIGARVSHAPIIQAWTRPVTGSGTAHMRRLKGPAAMCHCVWNQQMRSGSEITDWLNASALARPESLNGSPAQSAGFGPAPRSSASSWLIDTHEPERSISARAGTAASASRTAINKAYRTMAAPGRSEDRPLPRRRAGRRLPLRIGRFLLELRADDERRAQVLRVGRRDRHHEQR